MNEILGQQPQSLAVGKTCLAIDAVLLLREGVAQRVRLQILALAAAECVPRGLCRLPQLSCPSGNCTYLNFMGGYPSLNEVESGGLDTPGISCHCNAWQFPDLIDDPSITGGDTLNIWDVIDLWGMHVTAPHGER